MEKIQQPMLIALRTFKVFVACFLFVPYFLLPLCTPLYVIWTYIKSGKFEGVLQFMQKVENVNYWFWSLGEPERREPAASARRRPEQSSEDER